MTLKNQLKPVAGNRRTLESLAMALSDDDPVVREKARRELVAVRKAAVPLLIQVLSSKSRWARWEAVKALNEIGDPASARALVERLEDDVSEVRWTATEGLIRLGVGSLEPLLESLMGHSDSVLLRQGSHRILTVLASGDTTGRLAPVLEALEGPAPIIALPLAAYNALKPF